MNQESGYMDHSSEDWISTVIQNAQSKHPQVSERVRDTIEQSLNQQLSDRKLSSTNIKTIARKLLKAQTYRPPANGELQ